MITDTYRVHLRKICLNNFRLGSTAFLKAEIGALYYFTQMYIKKYKTGEDLNTSNFNFLFIFLFLAPIGCIAGTLELGSHFDSLELN